MTWFPRLVVLSLAAALVGGCAGSASRPAAGPSSPAGSAPLTAAAVDVGPAAPSSAPPFESDDPARASSGARGSARLLASGPWPVDPAALALADASRSPLVPGPVSLPDRPISPEEVARLRAEAQLLPPSDRVQRMQRGHSRRLGTELEAAGPTPASGGFTGPGFSNSVPPDPELAVGPDHVLAVVNRRMAVYEKGGGMVLGPIALDTFFAGTGDCDLFGSGAFDPNALYDEEADRFLLGADGNGTSYCLAASAGPDPTGAWNRYGILTPAGEFFDYPHAGVGREAIFVGSNQFSCGFPGCFFVGPGLLAIERAPLYAGQPPQVVAGTLASSVSTPQPANLHGFLQGTWPASGPHYVLTEDFDGAIHTVWSWDEPFGADLLVEVGDLDLEAATGVAAGFPFEAPQLDLPAGANPADQLESNDWRGLDTEYRNGRLWMTNTIACNPGGGSVACVRWAEIDPVAPAVVQAGVFATDGEHRIFPDLAANDCGDMAVGYTKTGQSMHPAVWATGRRSVDPPGTLQAEVELKAGEDEYDAFDASPSRWGDYSGMTVDPDGLTLWYFGEYSAAGGDWGTWIHPIIFPDCPLLPVPATADLGVIEVGASSPPVELYLFNLGSSSLAIAGIALSDTENFSLDELGGDDPCGSVAPVLAPLASCTVEVVFAPVSQAVFAATLDIAYAHPWSPRSLPIAGTGFEACPYADLQVLTNAEPEDVDIEVAACETVEIGPFQLGAAGDAAVTAGVAIVFHNGVEIHGSLRASIDPFLALP